MAGEALTLPAQSFEIHNLRQKLGSLFTYTLDNQPEPGVTGSAFLVLLLGSAMLASLPGNRQRPAAEDPPHAASAALLVLVPLLLYLLVPWAINGPVSHWYTYPRYATLTLASLLLLPRAHFAGRHAIWLLPGLLSAVVLNTSIALQFAQYAQRARPFLQIIDKVRPDSTYLPLQLEDDDPAMSFPPFSQIHAYIAAVKHGYDPHLFDNASIPFLYRQDRRLPQPRYDQAYAFDLAKHGRFYDYVWFRG